jgi:hypothetical protein
MNSGDRREARRSHRPTVFLCGPITGIPPAAATAWRLRATKALAGDAHIIDPTRDVLDAKRQSTDAAGQPLSVERMLHGKRTVARNLFDVRRSDLVMACFLGTESVSIGAVGEIFWAHVFSIPVVLVREIGNVHNHDMLNELAGWIFEDLDTAIATVRLIVGTLTAD